MSEAELKSVAAKITAKLQARVGGDTLTFKDINGKYIQTASSTNEILMLLPVTRSNNKVGAYIGIVSVD